MHENSITKCSVNMSNLRKTVIKKVYMDFVKFLFLFWGGGGADWRMATRANLKFPETTDFCELWPK